MGSVTDLATRRSARGRRPAGGSGAHAVVCAQCGERHPVVRLADGTLRCVTAFHDGARWFCRNRGCRAAWLAAHPDAGDT